jgi:hypothetical protein
LAHPRPFYVVLAPEEWSEIFENFPPFSTGGAGDESSIKQKTPAGNPANFGICLDAIKFFKRPNPRVFLKFQNRTLA